MMHQIQFGIKDYLVQVIFIMARGTMVHLIKEIDMMDYGTMVNFLMVHGTMVHLWGVNFLEEHGYQELSQNQCSRLYGIMEHGLVEILKMVFGKMVFGIKQLELNQDLVLKHLYYIKQYGNMVGGKVVNSIQD